MYHSTAPHKINFNVFIYSVNRNSALTRIRSLIILLFFSVALVGCVSPPVRMDAGLLDVPDQSIHVVIAQAPAQGKMYKIGNQGLLDLAINSALAQGVSGYLSTVPPTGFEPIVEKSIAQFEARNVTVTRHEEQIVFSDLAKRKRPPKGHYSFDLSEIIESTDASYILLLQCEGYGASRTYYGFIPTSYPQSTVIMSGVMIDRNHEIQWNHRGTYNVYVGSEWKQPPAYPLVTEALQQAWQLAEQDITGQLLGNEPVKQTVSNPE